MKHLGNIIWFILGGFISFLSWGILGVLWSITIIGAPIGAQCFKFAKMAAAPFGKDIRFSDSSPSFLLNIIWLLLGGFVLVGEELVMGAILCLTVIGIPFGLQHFKQAKLALFPVGAKIYKIA